MNRPTHTTLALAVGVLLLVAGSLDASEERGLTMGNGASNWISVDRATRTDNVLTFAEVHIEGDGWLVIHPFQDGKPNGDRVVGVTRLDSGTNDEVLIEVPKGLETGERMIVMLHRDSNDNGTFDFIFVDDHNVLDRAVFEGPKMIGHVFTAP